MKKENFKKAFHTVALGTLALFSGALIGDIINNRPMTDKDVLKTAFNLAVENHVSRPDPASLRGKNLDELLKSLDPHSLYHPPEEYKKMQQEMSGEYGGLGLTAEFDKERSLIKIASPTDNTPASRAGIQKGDIITHLNGKSIQGTDLKEAAKIMRGEPGTKITLTIKRDSKELDVTITRAIIKIPSVESRIIGNDIGYIQIKTFNNKDVDASLGKEIKKVQAEMGNRVKGYIIDLRNNPGGHLNQSMKIADRFLNQGVIVSVGTGSPNDKEHIATQGDITNGKPVIILTNGGSASASEVVAGALQDHGRALILGTQTYGKGSVQLIYELRNGGAIRLTTKHYFTPSKDSIQGVGITPDTRFVPLKKANKMSKEADLEGMLANPNTGQDNHRTTKTCSPGQNVITENIDPDALLRDGKPDFQLLCAVDTLLGTATYTNTAPVPALMPQG